MHSSWPCLRASWIVFIALDLELWNANAPPNIERSRQNIAGAILSMKGLQEGEPDKS